MTRGLHLKSAECRWPSGPHRHDPVEAQRLEGQVGTEPVSDGVEDGVDGPGHDAAVSRHALGAGVQQQLLSFNTIFMIDHV